METFYTIQGEGFHQGRAAYFIRLGGCDVGCSWCDVKESWDAAAHPILSVEQIVSKAIEEVRCEKSKVKSQNPIAENGLVIITGGEPLLHNLDNLTSLLKVSGFETNIETSGSSPLSGQWDWICLSPKKFKPPIPEVIAAANELKIVVYNKDDFKWAEKYAAEVTPSCKLYLQPEWSNIANMMPLMVDYIKANPQWELSLQIHKYINVP